LGLQPETVRKLTVLRQAMDAWMPHFTDDLAWMVSQDRGFMHKAGVDAAVDWMQARLNQLGCETQRFSSIYTGDTLAGTLRGSGQGRYLLIAHLDTVWSAGTSAGWPLRIEGSRAYGPGVVDNGSGSLTGYYVLKSLKQFASDCFETVTLVCNGDEESGSLFSGDIIQHLARGCDAAFCLEAPAAPDEIISQRGGSMGVTLHVAGQRAHTQIEPEKGANAILELSHKIIAAHQLKADNGLELICVVTTQGGPQSGTVPDTARAEFDVRLTSLDDITRVKAYFGEIAARSWVFGTTASFDSLLYHPPMERLEASPRLVRLAQDIGQVFGRAIKDTYCEGVSDACFGSVVGVPTLCGLAPFGGDYHTRGEWLDLSNVAERVTLVAGLVSAYAITHQDMEQQ
jgi:glutamate carboxypeptidase